MSTSPSSKPVQDPDSGERRSIMKDGVIVRVASPANSNKSNSPAASPSSKQGVADSINNNNDSNANSESNAVNVADQPNTVISKESVQSQPPISSEATAETGTGPVPMDGVVSTSQQQQQPAPISSSSSVPGSPLQGGVGRVVHVDPQILESLATQLRARGGAEGTSSDGSQNSDFLSDHHIADVLCSTAIKLREARDKIDEQQKDIESIAQVTTHNMTVLATIEKVVGHAKYKLDGENSTSGTNTSQQTGAGGGQQNKEETPKSYMIKKGDSAMGDRPTSAQSQQQQSHQQQQQQSTIRWANPVHPTTGTGNIHSLGSSTSSTGTVGMSSTSTSSFGGQQIGNPSAPKLSREEMEKQRSARLLALEKQAEQNAKVKEDFERKARVRESWGR